MWRTFQNIFVDIYCRLKNIKIWNAFNVEHFIKLNIQFFLSSSLNLDLQSAVTSSPYIFMISYTFLIHNDFVKCIQQNFT